MNIKELYLLLRKSAIKEYFRTETINISNKTGLNLRTVRGLVQIIDNTEDISVSTLRDWIDPEYYTFDKVNNMAKDPLLSLLIPSYFYENIDFIKENNIDELPKGFMEDSNIKSFIIVPGIRRINDQAFKNCQNLKYVYFAEEIEEIGIEAFMGCENLISVSPSKKLRYIGQRAYKNCSSLEQAYIPENITHIEKETFENCTDLELIISDRKEINIAERAFKNCKSLKQIKYRNHSVIFKNIGESAFKNCQLETISLSNGEIEERAFLGNKSLKQINIIKPPLIIQEDAFAECSPIDIILSANTSKIELMGIKNKAYLLKNVEEIKAEDKK